MRMSKGRPLVGWDQSSKSCGGSWASPPSLWASQVTPFADGRRRHCFGWSEAGDGVNWACDHRLPCPGLALPSPTESVCAGLQWPGGKALGRGSDQLLRLSNPQLPRVARWQEPALVCPACRCSDAGGLMPSIRSPAALPSSSQTSAGALRPALTSVSPWGGYLASQCLGFLICKWK